MKVTLTSEMGVSRMSKEDWSGLIYFLHPWTVNHRSGPSCYLARTMYRLAWARHRKLRGASKDGGDLYQRRAIRYLHNRVADIGPFRISVARADGKLVFLLKTREFRRMTPMGRIVVRAAAVGAKVV